MDQVTYSALATMYNGFRASGEDTELRLRTLGELVKGFPGSTVVEVARRFTGGQVQGHNPTFAPTTAEFMREVERLHDLRDYKPRLSAPVSRPDDGGMTPWEMRIAKAKQENAGRPIIKENVGHMEFVAMRKTLPPGSVWVACLATVYGPIEKQQAAEKA